jgi:hypothetical protein
MLKQFRDKSIEIVLPDQPPDLREGVVGDLAAVEHLLVAAEEKGIRFYLDVVWQQATPSNKSPHATTR